MRFDCLYIFVDHKKCVLGSLWLQGEKEMMGSQYYRLQFAMHGRRVQYLGLSPSLCLSNSLLNPVYFSGSHSWYRALLGLFLVLRPPAGAALPQLFCRPGSSRQSHPPGKSVRDKTERLREPTSHLVRFMEYTVRPHPTSRGQVPRKWCLVISESSWLLQGGVLKIG